MALELVALLLFVWALVLAITAGGELRLPSPRTIATGHGGLASR